MAAVSIDDLWLEALAVVEEALHSNDEKIRFKAAALILELSTRLAIVP